MAEANGKQPKQREIEDVLFPELRGAVIKPSQNLVNAFAGARGAKFALNDFFYHLDVAVRKGRECNLTGAFQQFRSAADARESAGKFIRETLKEERKPFPGSRWSKLTLPGPLEEELEDAQDQAEKLLIEALQKECGCELR